MIVPVTANGRPCLALAISRINSRADVKALRDALLDVIDSCLISEETKEVTESKSLHILLNMIVELNKDLED